MQYFRDIYSGVSTVLTGMWITFKHLFEPNITVQYPKQKLEMYPRTRARLVNHIEDCGFCLSCAKVCPVHIFTIKGVKMEPGEPERIMPDGKPKKMHVIQFDIDMSKCLYCGLCVEACDTRSLRWDKPQEEVAFNRNDFYHEFSDFTVEQREAMLAKEEARKAAAAAARAAGGGATPGAVKAAPVQAVASERKEGVD
jgi:NADH-quinone oxidoreductase subunit I